jgi:hypothetical protein
LKKIARLTKGGPYIYWNASAIFFPASARSFSLVISALREGGKFQSAAGVAFSRFSFSG